MTKRKGGVFVSLVLFSLGGVACSDDTSSGGQGGAGGAQATGGAPQGGGGALSQGGGGAAAQGGSGGAGGGMAPGVAVAECVTVDDCRLVDDCCRCESLLADTPAPSCGVTDCTTTLCGRALNVDGPDCLVGQCVASIDCDPAGVSCVNFPEPVCPDGQVAAVTENCWGDCVLAHECTFVPDCAKCGTTDTCVHVVVGPSEVLHCVPTPTVCTLGPTCDCMGEAVCGALPCDDSGPGIVCGGQ